MSPPTDGNVLVGTVDAGHDHRAVVEAAQVVDHDGLGGRHTDQGYGVVTPGRAKAANRTCLFTLSGSRAQGGQELVRQKGGTVSLLAGAGTERDYWTSTKYPWI